MSKLVMSLVLIILPAMFCLGARAGDFKPISQQPNLKPQFTPPAPGTYELQHIQPAGDGNVLDIDGSEKHLAQFTGGKVTLLTFIYSSCSDPAGCPFAYLVYHQLKSRIGKDPRLAGKVRLVSLSFDPVHDTPQLLKLYAGDDADPGQPVEWKFLTTRSVKELLPILDDYGQDVFVALDPVTKKPSGGYSHVLKAFLIDSHHEVREIYTSSYLMPDVIYNDILTLLMEQGLKQP